MKNILTILVLFLYSCSPTLHTGYYRVSDIRGNNTVSFETLRGKPIEGDRLIENISFGLKNYLRSMATPKTIRLQVFNKYGGKCAYCGCELQKGWHVDELEPCRRKYRKEKAHWLRLSDKKKMSIREVNELDLSEQELWQNYKLVEDKTVFDGYEHPERLHIDNQMPACASCNINKHSMDLEDFRNLIAGFMKHLNEVSTQYKIAKRYGLVEETSKEVLFYFETVSKLPSAEGSVGANNFLNGSVAQ